MLERWTEADVLFVWTATVVSETVSAVVFFRSCDQLEHSPARGDAVVDGILVTNVEGARRRGLGNVGRRYHAKFRGRPLITNSGKCVDDGDRAALPQWSAESEHTLNSAKEDVAPAYAAYVMDETLRQRACVDVMTRCSKPLCFLLLQVRSI